MSVCVYIFLAVLIASHTHTHYEKFSSSFSSAIDSDVSLSLQETSVCISFEALLQGRAFFTDFHS